VRGYRYVGPADVAAAARQAPAGTPVASEADLTRWLSAVDRRDLTEPFTYVVDAAAVLRLAPRRSEHVACASGGEVLGAGEIAFERHADGGWAVAGISNQSTGYCPDLASWPAVAAALDKLGIRRPEGFTIRFIFRRCPRCQERNVVKDADFTCCVCGSDLPARWNVD
jgi:hypothetical protein